MAHASLDESVPSSNPHHHVSGGKPPLLVSISRPPVEMKPWRHLSSNASDPSHQYP
ncbi:hypothetical protein ACFZB6_12140 [Streptomyces syringium]|uniref:hypothetical protein n=1 Tax=Streptomyces syringium TaxID=76729 RepID=UPI0036E8A4F3